MNALAKTIMDLSIENAYIKYAKAFDRLTNRMVKRGKLEEFNTPYLVAFVRWISENSAYPENYVEEILQVACIIRDRSDEPMDNRIYAIEKLKGYAMSYHPYGHDFGRRIDEVVR